MIRQAILNDIPEMIKIYNHAIEDEVYANCDMVVSDRDKFQSNYFFDQENYLSLVSISEEGRINGWGALKKFSARPYDKSIAEVAVYIARSSRSTGLGIYILRRLIYHARKVKFHSIVAIIIGKNEQSIRGCQSCGFNEAVRMPNIAKIYQSNEDIIWLQKFLDQD